MSVTESCKIAFACLNQYLKDFSPNQDLIALRQYLPNELTALSEESDLFAIANKIGLGVESPTKRQFSQLSSLFEEITFTQQREHGVSSYFYPTTELTPNSIFPTKKDSNTKAQSKAQLWETFVKSLQKIPNAHKSNLPLWLDHFDTALQCFTTNLPSYYAEDISFYDHLKTTTAIATALAVDKKEQAAPLLLIQGDFFGIQDFIFSGGSETNKQAAKLLRGRSFQVALFTELAALKILEACELPSTSQLMNAAGKFLIIAPNTENIRQKVNLVKQELNAWFLKNTYGLIGLGIATKATSAKDFMGDNFSQLQKALFTQLEVVKLQRLDLISDTESVQEVSYPFGVCQYNNYFPASNADNKSSFISDDQVKIGKYLATKSRIIICRENARIYDDNRTQSLTLSIFGYRVIFTDSAEITGKFSEPAKTAEIIRLWDFALPKDFNQSIWNGYARRYINAYIPYFKNVNNFEKEKYKNIEEDWREGNIKTFDYLACEDQIIDKEGNYIGQTALMTLKGDVDNLGMIFQKGLTNKNFAKIAALSRQINQFFSLWLPTYCAVENPNMYTVFAGGDDFFLIGPWYSTQKLALAMQQNFAKYVVNPQIHFSAGMVMTKVGMPVPQMGEMAENALAAAKNIKGKNAVTIYQHSVQWNTFIKLFEFEKEIERLAKDYNISNSYFYRLIYFSMQAENEDNKIENTIWRSHFYYRTVRYVIDRLKEINKDQALKEIIVSLGEKGIAQYKKSMIIPLFNYFYKTRQ